MYPFARRRAPERSGALLQRRDDRCRKEDCTNFVSRFLRSHLVALPIMFVSYQLLECPPIAIGYSNGVNPVTAR